MINISATPSLSKILTESVPDVTKTWKVGQILNATAERNVAAQNNILIRIGQSILQAKTPVAINAGEPLKLLVKSLGNTPVLKIQTSGSSPAHTAASNLKSFIGRQQDLTGLLQLSQKIIDMPSTTKALKQQLINLNQQLPSITQATQATTLQNLIKNSGVLLESKLNHLQQQEIKQNALQYVQLGHHMLNQDIKSQLLIISAQLQGDVPELTAKSQITPSKNIQAVLDTLVKQFIKSEINLTQLATQLTIHLSKNQSQLIRQALTSSETSLLPRALQNSFTLLFNYIQQQARPKQIQDNLSGQLKTMALLQELKTGIDGALAKITSQQLTTLTREADSLLLLLFDIYLKDKTENHLIQFRLEQEKSEQEPNGSSWTVALNFNFNGAGPIEARLHLTNNTLSTVFCAEKENTAKEISKQINLLDTAFTRIGFDAINLDVTQGSISKPLDLAKNVYLLDEKA
jgi:hypothetical protein